MDDTGVTALAVIPKAEGAAYIAVANRLVTLWSCPSPGRRADGRLVVVEADQMPRSDARSETDFTAYPLAGTGRR